MRTAALRAVQQVDKKDELRAVHWDGQMAVHSVELSAVLREAWSAALTAVAWGHPMVETWGPWPVCLDAKMAEDSAGN